MVLDTTNNPPLPTGFVPQQSLVLDALVDYLQLKTNATWSRDANPASVGITLTVGSFTLQNDAQANKTQDYSPKIYLIPLVVYARYVEGNDAIAAAYDWMDVTLLFIQQDLYFNGHEYQGRQFFKTVEIDDSVTQGYGTNTLGDEYARSQCILRWRSSNYNRENRRLLIA